MMMNDIEAVGPIIYLDRWMRGKNTIIKGV